MMAGFASSLRFTPSLTSSRELTGLPAVPRSKFCRSPTPYVHPSKYVPYKLNPDLKTGEQCITFLAAAGFDVSANKTFDWITTPSSS
jgi:hypothetical protein